MTSLLDASSCRELDFTTYSIYTTMTERDENNIGQENTSTSTSPMASAPLKRKAVDLAAAEAKKPKSNGSITSFFGAPKSNSSTSSTNPSKPPTDPAPVVFNKEEWIAKLDPDTKALLTLEIETLHESWLAVLKDEVTKKSFLDLKRFLKSEGEKGAFSKRDFAKVPR